jgi:hypothetical protein
MADKTIGRAGLAAATVGEEARHAVQTVVGGVALEALGLGGTAATQVALVVSVFVVVVLAFDADCGGVTGEAALHGAGAGRTGARIVVIADCTLNAVVDGVAGHTVVNGSVAEGAFVVGVQVVALDAGQADAAGGASATAAHGAQTAGTEGGGCVQVVPHIAGLETGVFVDEDLPRIIPGS